MTRRTAIWLATIPFVVLAALGHWIYWYQPRLRADAPGEDLPSRILRSEGFDTAVWIAHPHQNLPTLAEMTGLDAPGLAAALRLAGVTGADAPRLGQVRIPPASSLAVAASDDGEHVMAAARVHPLAAGFLRLAGMLASNPWLEGGTVRVGTGAPGESAVEVTLAWRGATWTAATNPADLDGLDEQTTESDGWAPAVAWVRHRSASATSDGRTVLPSGRLVLLATEGSVRLASRQAAAASGDRPPRSDRLEQGRRVLEAGEALLVLMRGATVGDAAPEQSMLLLPLPADTDVSELPRSAVLHRTLPSAGAGGKVWKLPGEQLLEIAGHDLPRGAAAGWEVRATDAIGLGSALAAAPELRKLTELKQSGAGGLPTWGLWLDVSPASVEIDRLARGLEQSPFLRRSDRLRWNDAAIVLRSMARRPARVEGLVDGDRVLLRWVATYPSG